jgi:hypothetical protein
MIYHVMLYFHTDWLADRANTSEMFFYKMAKSGIAAASEVGKRMARAVAEARVK